MRWYGVDHEEANLGTMAGEGESGRLGCCGAEQVPRVLFQHQSERSCNCHGAVVVLGAGALQVAVLQEVGVR